MQRRGAAAEVAVSCYQLSDDRTHGRCMGDGESGHGGLALRPARVRLPRASSFSGRASIGAESVRRFNEPEMKYSDFIPLLYPGETLPSDVVRPPPDNLRNAYTVN